MKALVSLLILVMATCTICTATPNRCEESYYFWFSDTWSAYTDRASEIDECPTQHWRHLIADKQWVDVTKEEFMQATCLVEYSVTTDGKVIKNYPRPEWLHCEVKSQDTLFDDMHFDDN